MLKTSWPATSNQDARSIAKGLAVLARSYASELPDVVSMEISLEFILASGEVYQGGIVSLSLASIRANPSYAETIEDNLVAQVHPLRERATRFESAR